MYAYLGRRKWQPTPVILPGEHHEQRSLAGYSPWGCKESGMTEQLSFIHSYLGTSTYAKIKSISSTSEGPSAPLTANAHLPCPALCSSGLCHRRLMSTVLQLHTVEPDRTYALYCLTSFTYRGVCKARPHCPMRVSLALFHCWAASHCRSPSPCIQASVDFSLLKSPWTTVQRVKAPSLFLLLYSL